MVNKKKRTCPIIDFTVADDEKNQRKQKEGQMLERCQRTKKTMEHESDDDTSCNWCIWNNPQRLGKGVGRVGNRWTN